MPEAATTQAARQNLQKPGARLLAMFYGALQAVRLYPLENDTVQTAIENLHSVTERLLEDEGSVEFRALGGCLLLNHTRIRLSVSGHMVFGALERILGRHEIGALEFQTGIRRQEWAPFLKLLLAPAVPGEAFAAFQRQQQDLSIEHIEVQRRSVGGGAGEEGTEIAARVYVQSVQVAREALVGLRLGRAVNARKVKRSVQGIVDQVLNNEVALLGMTALRHFDEYTFTHSVNVCILSVVLGQRLGLEKRQLYELGLCALLHDVGKTRIDPDLVNKPGTLTADEWKEMRVHPREGLLAMLQLRGFPEIPYRQMLAAYEHHMKVDLTGYPCVRRSRRPSLFSRIVAVVDTFDAVSSARSYRSRGWAPDKVLRNMRDEPGWGLDRVVVKAFMSATGIYPIGTVVVLDDGSLATVVSPNPEAPEAPVVQVITDPTGQPLAEPFRLDLAAEQLAGRSARCRILRSVDPAR